MEITPDKIRQVLESVFKISGFRNTQEEIITRVMKGGHSLVLMPTGMGKSLCYQLPAVLMDGLTVVLSPLISLMKDQVDSLLKLGIDAAYINSSLSRMQRDRRYRNIKEGKYKILFVAPERFKKEDFRDVISCREISLLAVDEAHCVSQWGHDFRPDYSRIAEFREVLGYPTTIALTATATPAVQDDIIVRTGIESAQIKTFNEGICRPNLKLEVDNVIDESEKFDMILKLIQRRNGSKIVYFNLIKSIDKFSDYLCLKKVRHHVYHGKLAPAERKRIQNVFLSPKSGLMLATNAFGMGIDKPDIRMIVHAEIPDSIEAYYQEIGRGGRDGKPSDCILIYNEDDLAVQLEFLYWRNPSADFIKKTFHLLNSMGDTINSYTYEDIQEKLVFKNRGDNRLQTVLNLFDRQGVTKGSLDSLNLQVISELPDEIISEDYINIKIQHDRQRLVDMLNYVKTPDCRRDYIHSYFGIDSPECDNCDNCV